MRRASRIDKPLAILLVILVVGGAFVFSSAAFGLLGRGETHITSVVFTHFALGLGLGLLALLLGLTVDYRIWRRYALARHIRFLLSAVRSPQGCGHHYGCGIFRRYEDENCDVLVRTGGIYRAHGRASGPPALAA